MFLSEPHLRQIGGKPEDAALEAQILVLAEQNDARITGQRGAKMSSSQAGQEVIKRAGKGCDFLVLDGFTKRARRALRRGQSLATVHYGFSQSFPHLNDPSFQVEREFIVGSFGSCRFRRRKIGSPNIIFSGLKPRNAWLRGQAS